MNMVMKKIKIFIALAVMFGGQAAAQDTIHRNSPLGNYYCLYWPDTTEFGGGGTICTFEYAREIGKQFYTRDSLTVYGIAAGMIHFLFNGAPCKPAPFWLKDTAE